MQLVVKYGFPVTGVACNVVVASYTDGVDVPMDQHPGAVLVPYAGIVEDLERVGPEPDDPATDTRFRRAPAVDLLAYAASRRYAIETGGITVGDAFVRTDRESQALLTGAYLRALQNPDRIISFKAASVFVKLPAAEIITLGDAVGDHVQACFEVEEAIGAAYGEGTITKVAQVDDAFAALGR